MPRSRFLARIKRAALPAALLMPLAGCGTTDRIVTPSIPLEDYKLRHPISIVEERTSIDVFPSIGAGHLDRHTAKQVFAFAEQYRDLGQGPILILVPRGVGETKAGVAEIRHILAQGGARFGAEVSTYAVADSHLASPVRISFQGMKARVHDQCGQWPSDLASGSSIESWENKPYWNLGCATQTMIAAQTSDPRDLVTPRGEEAPDTLIRSRAIESIRKGSDPNTTWSTKNSNIGGIGGS